MSLPLPELHRVDLGSLGETAYRGSVQHLHTVPDQPEYLVCQTTEAGSVFDVGSIFHIAGNDVSRALFRHLAYTRLGDPGSWAAVEQALRSDPNLPEDWREALLAGPLEAMLEAGALTHHIGMVDASSGEVVRDGVPDQPSSFNVVRRFPVLTPPQRGMMTGHVFDYAQFHQSSTYVIPLEYIVRFGITSGSSILRKYRAMSEVARQNYEQELGLSGPMVPWSHLTPAIFDLTSKYEPEDRNVTRQEALLMSGLSANQFEDTVKMALLGGYALREWLRPIGLELWDLKWEFAVDRGELMFVDTIDADSFRATRRVRANEDTDLIVHFNKQAMRDYYQILHPEWYAAVNDAKARAKETGRVFRDILAEEQDAGNYPNTPTVEPAFLSLQGRKSQLVGQQLLHPGDAERSEALGEELETCGQEEIVFYRDHDRLEALMKINGVPRKI